MQIDQVSWDFGDPNSGANNTENGENVTHVFSAPGEYIVTMTTIKSGVSSSERKQITISPIPQINMEEKIYLCDEESITLDATNSDANYLWNDNSTEPILVVTDLGTYGVTVTNGNGCSTSKEINVNDGCGDNNIFLPSAFSPNSDGRNDLFYVRGENICLPALITST